ncbi:MAG: Fic family protein [Candidatus Diapherotrites archaeon]
MVSKYDLLYSVYLEEGLTASQLVKKLGKTQQNYQIFYNHLKELEEEKLLEFKNNKCFLVNSDKTRNLLKLIDFCVSNGIHYNELFLPKTIEFIKIGLQKNILENLSFNSRTISRISLFLVKHGFILIESKKPFKARIVYSGFLKNLVEFFEINVKINCKNVFEEANEKKLNSDIEKEFSKYKKQTKQISLDEKINFIHRSLSLEGNTLTLGETEKLIKKNIPAKGKTFKEMQEIIDYKKALDKLIQEKKPLNYETVLEFHSIAMNSLKAGAGELRKQKVKIKGNPKFKPADWKEIPLKISKLFDFYEKNINSKMKASETIEFASFLHSEFQWIHPFIDGNSRTSRAIFIHTLLLKGFPLITSTAGFIYQYMQLTKLSQKRNDKNFTLFKKQLVLHSLKQTNQKLKYN